MLLSNAEIIQVSKIPKGIKISLILDNGDWIEEQMAFDSALYELLCQTIFKRIIRPDRSFRFTDKLLRIAVQPKEDSFEIIGVGKYLPVKSRKRRALN